MKMKFENESPSERMKRKVLKENLWYFILQIIKTKPVYAYKLREMIENNFGFWVGNVTAYKVLYKLEKKSYVKKKMISGKVYYEITKKGFQELKKAKTLFKKLAKN